MANLLSIPENVMIQQLFPYLDHNDLLRLRRVSKQTKALAEAYLWTPKEGHQGKWILRIDSSKEDQTLRAFLQLGLPPPSRLYIVNRAENGSSERGSFFEDDHLEDFMERYGKYVTYLRLDKLFFPFTSAKELGFYESLVNLKKLRCAEMITVGGAAQFEEKTGRAEGSFLMRPAFQKLKVFKLDQTDCMDSMWNFINGMSNNLEELLHPFQRRDVHYQLPQLFTPTKFGPVQELIERHGMKSQSKLLYDWRYLFVNETDPLGLLRVFASCRDNGVIIKNLSANCLDCLLCDKNGRIADRDELVDSVAREWIENSLVNYQRNLFVGSIIHSLEGLTDNVFLMEMPALENTTIYMDDDFEIYRRRGVGYPQWPNLRKMDVALDYCTREHFTFLWEEVKRPKLEELSLIFGFGIPDQPLPFPRDLGNCCGNVKKLFVNCPWPNDFFLSLWEGLPLLEDVILHNCRKLTIKGFVGNSVAGSRPVFLNLEKLKHLTIQSLETMPRITNTVFKNVFRHSILCSFTLSSDIPIRSITVAGIKELLTGSFGETIQKLNLDQLKLQDVSKEELKKVVSSFRSSKML